MAKEGVCAEMRYGEQVDGINNPLLRDMRKVHAATSMIKVPGSSTTAKLALGGAEYGEFDPAVTRVNPPLAALLGMLLDRPQTRSAFVQSWRQAQEEVGQAEPTKRWSKIRGPVGAAWAHLLRIEAAWPRPFQLQLLDENINIIEMPPVQVMTIMTAHARRFYDRIMIRRLCVDNDWEGDAVMDKYHEGVHWDVIRDLMRSSSGIVDAKEKRAMMTLVCGGFWPEYRRWKHGLADSPECTACHGAPATPAHRLHQCDAMEYQRTQWLAAGRVTNDKYDDCQPGDAPMWEMGLPPMPMKWSPIDIDFCEGHLNIGGGNDPGGDMYGDGSGYNQDSRVCRIATWALVRPKGDDVHTQDNYERLRGVVCGWFSTVPRGELRGLIEFMKYGGPDETYISDCQYVVEGIRHGIPRRLTSSKSVNADMWREARRLLADRGSTPMVCKTKAHRSRAAAERDDEEPIRRWHGNRIADEEAKQLAKSIAEKDDRAERIEATVARSSAILARVAIAAAWAYQRWPEVVRTVQNKGDEAEAEDDVAHEDRHVVRRGAEGRVECQICGRYGKTKSGMRKLRTEKCSGSALQHVHATHHMCNTAGTMWCIKCGAFTTRWPRRLRFECLGRPATVAQRNVLRRLRTELAPTTADDLRRDTVAAREHGLAMPQQDADNDGQLTTRTIGMYARLPGGHLYRHTDSSYDAYLNTDTANRTDHHNTNKSPSPSSSQARSAQRGRDLASTAADGEPRETTVPHTLLGGNKGADQSGAADAERICNPTTDTPWTRRTAAKNMPCAKTCAICGALTRLTCRGCHLPCCIECAKARRKCRPPTFRDGSASFPT